MTAKMVRCPQCGTSVKYQIDNPSRPFCSSRCKLIDLGAWAEERYAISGANDVRENSDEQDGSGPQDDLGTSKQAPGIN